MNPSINDIEIFYQRNTRYEITINPNDKHQFFGSVRRLELFVMSIQKLLIIAFDNYNIQYKLYLELSEPIAINKDCATKSSSGSRLHLHGTFECDSDIVMGLFLLKGQYYLSRWADIQINDYRKVYWPKYCCKQKLIMKALGKYHKVPMVLHDKMALIKR